MPRLKMSGKIPSNSTGYDFKVDGPFRPLMAIRMKCRERQAENLAKVRRCEMTDCALWPYRLARRPVGTSTHHERVGSGSKGHGVDTKDDDARVHCDDSA